MNSKELFARAERVIPGGVNSPVRAFKAVGGEPIFVSRGAGSKLVTVEGRTLVDFCGSWGPLLFGHARPEVVEAVCAAAREGTSFGVNGYREVEFAEQLCRRVPSMGMVRLVNSGTEAVMTALRIARGFTGRGKILKFEGCYHGHSDALLVSAGSGLLTGGLASSAGLPPGLAAETLVAPYNDISSVRTVVQAEGRDLAAIIVEPVAGNMGLIPPERGFLEGLREAADSCGALLIFDEVITGFRFGPTSYGAIAGVAADLSCFGKIIGGGLPLAAVGGRTEAMSTLAPLGKVYQAGTLSGNPVAVAAGLAMLDLIDRESPYPRLATLGARIAEGLSAAAGKAGVPLSCARLGGVFTPFFAPEKPLDLSGARRSDTASYARFFRGMLKRGFYLPPSQFEAAFVSAAHSDEEVDAFLSAAEETLAEMAP